MAVRARWARWVGGVGCALLLAPACSTAPTLFSGPRASYAVSESDGRRAVAFLAPFDEDEQPREVYAATLMALRTALSRLADCAEIEPRAVDLLLVKRVDVTSGSGSWSFLLPGVAGIVLMDGAREPHLVEGGARPNGVQARLLADARDYYPAPRCGSAPVSK